MPGSQTWGYVFVIGTHAAEGVGTGRQGSSCSQCSCWGPGCSEGLDQTSSSKVCIRRRSKKKGSCISVLPSPCFLLTVLGQVAPPKQSSCAWWQVLAQTQPTGLTGTTWEPSLLKLPFSPYSSTSGNWNSPRNSPGGKGDVPPTCRHGLQGLDGRQIHLPGIGRRPGKGRPRWLKSRHRKGFRSHPTRPSHFTSGETEAQEGK